MKHGPIEAFAGDYCFEKLTMSSVLMKHGPIEARGEIEALLAELRSSVLMKHGPIEAIRCHSVTGGSRQVFRAHEARPH